MTRNLGEEVDASVLNAAMLISYADRLLDHAMESWNEEGLPAGYFVKKSLDKEILRKV